MSDVLPDVVTFGEALASVRAREPGPLRLGGSLQLSIAGAESNVAIGLARLGHRVRWVGRVGADEPGALVLRTLRAEGVDVDHVEVDSSRPTGLMLVERRTEDVVRVDYRRKDSAGAMLTPAALEAALDPVPRIVHATGITPALSAGAREAFATTLHRTAQLGSKVCLDVNYRRQLWDHADAFACLRDVVPDVHILVASEDELGLVAGVDEEAAAVQTLHDAGVREVVVKRGSRGASAFRKGETAHCAAPTVAVHDILGAGDAFTAGYLSATLDGEKPAARLERGVQVAAIAIGCLGDWEGLPWRDDLPLAASPPGTTLR